MAHVIHQMWYRWLLSLDLLQQLPRMVLGTTTNLLDQEDCYSISSLEKFCVCNFMVTDNREKFLTAKISQYTVVANGSNHSTFSLSLSDLHSLIRCDLPPLTVKFCIQLTLALAAAIADEVMSFHNAPCSSHSFVFRQFLFTF